LKEQITADLVLDKYKSVGINEENGEVSVVGDFYHVTDIFGRPIHNHENPQEFQNALQGADQFLQYQQQLEQFGATFESTDMINKGNKLVLKGSVMVP